MNNAITELGDVKNGVAGHKVDRWINRSWLMDQRDKEEEILAKCMRHEMKTGGQNCLKYLIIKELTVDMS